MARFHTYCMRVATALVFLFLAAALRAQSPDELFGRAVLQSLARSHAIFPDAAKPGSPLSQAILYRIDWLNRNNPEYFANPEWPLQLTATEAARLGLGPQDGDAAPPPAAAPADQRYLGVVTKNFGITGVSFRKGQQVIIEALRDYGKRGVILVEGQPVVLWLDHIKLVRELSPGEPSPLVVKIVSARYGPPGTKGYVVSSAVQTALGVNAQGAAELVVSDALLPTATAQRLNRPTTTIDPATGQPIGPGRPKVLSVVYEIGGVEKTRQAQEGDRLVLD